MDKDRSNTQSFRPMQDIVPRRVRPSGETVSRPATSEISDSPVVEQAPAPAAPVAEPSQAPVMPQKAEQQVVSVPVVQPDDALPQSGRQGSDAKHHDEDAELESIIEEVHAEKAEANPSGATGATLKRKRPILVAVVALVAAIGLAAVAYFAFANTQASTTAAPTTSDQIFVSEQ